MRREEALSNLRVWTLRKKKDRVTHAWSESCKKCLWVAIEWKWKKESGGFENKRKVQTESVKETKKREDSGWRVKGEVGVYVTVSKPQEQQRKAVNGSSPCFNRLRIVLQSTANHKSSWRLVWVRALTHCLPPDQRADAGRGEWKRQKETEGRKTKRWRESVVLKKVRLQDLGFAFSSLWPWGLLLGIVCWSKYASSALSLSIRLSIFLSAWLSFSNLDMVSLSQYTWPSKACHMASKETFKHCKSTWHFGNSFLSGQIHVTQNC